MNEPMHALLAIFLIAFLSLALTVFADVNTRPVEPVYIPQTPTPSRRDLYGGYGRHASTQGLWRLDDFMGAWITLSEDQKDEYCQEFPGDRDSVISF